MNMYAQSFHLIELGYKARIRELKRWWRNGEISYDKYMQALDEAERAMVNLHSLNHDNNI